MKDNSKKVVAVVSEIIAPLSVAMIALYVAHITNSPWLIAYFAGAIFISYILQNLIGRKRPYIMDHLQKYGGIIFDSKYSFPSVHATSLGIFFPVLFILNAPLSYIWLVWILIIGWTRVYLNMHYVSDVIAGILWGMLLGVVVLALL